MLFEIPYEYKNLSGIYSITNTVNGKRLIGSTVNFGTRFLDYKSKLKLNKQTNSYLQSSYNKHGVNAFKMEWVCLCPENSLLKLEDFYMSIYKTRDPNFGYNFKDAIRQSGRKCSEETKKKISDALKGNKHTLGFKHTQETKDKVSKGLTGKKLSQEHKNKISAVQLGKTRSKETCEKISIALSKRVWTDEMKLKMSNSHKGKVISQETREKMRIAKLGKKHNRSI